MSLDPCIENNDAFEVLHSSVLAGPSHLEASALNPKMDLVVVIYRDSTATAPVPLSAAAARARLLAQQRAGRPGVAAQSAGPKLCAALYRMAEPPVKVWDVVLSAPRAEEDADEEEEEEIQGEAVPTADEAAPKSGMEKEYMAVTGMAWSPDGECALLAVAVCKSCSVCFLALVSLVLA